MRKQIHGGDIYRNCVQLDFSVNVNPLGVPKAVMEALQEAVALCQEYPDIRAEKLRKVVSDMLRVPPDYLLFGNGASELFMSVIHAVKPRKTVIPVPSFYGYEYVAAAGGGEIEYYEMKEEDSFSLTDDLFEILTEEVDILFLANPNNPTGYVLERVYLKRLLQHCKEKRIMVVLDECFLSFCGKETSMLDLIDAFDNLIIIRAFTKIFAIPGVRLGYLVCSNKMLLESIQKQLPEWNLSCFAQAAGCACAKQLAFVEQTVDYVRMERQFLVENLKKMGITVFPGETNFILVCSEKLLYEKLLEQGILIRDCENFRGLSKGFYRIAVRNRQENEALLRAIKEVVNV